MNIKRYPAVELAKKAADEINTLLNSFKEEKILFLVSGGSSFKAFEKIDENVLGENITISVLDERFSNDGDINNFLQLQKNDFYARAVAKGCTFISTVPLPGETLEKMVERFEKALKSWKRTNPTGKVVISLGIGRDGHTAGIMCFPENPSLFKELFESEKWAVGYDAGTKNPYPKRVTTTITFLRDLVDYSIVYADSPDKNKIIDSVLSKDPDLAVLPASVIKLMKNVILFIPA